MNSEIKKSILAKLSSTTEPISGQLLADELHISRTMIWKYLKSLEEEGYEIEAIKKKGYVLKSSPDILSPERISPYLQTEQIGRTISYYPVCDSTQTIATREARADAPHGTIVIADEQIAGRGRLDRSWSSAANKGIWMSVILRPQISPQFASQYTLVAAVAVAKAIEELTDISPSIKWPNDLLIEGKKITGILTELQADMDRVHSIIIGIGINVNHTAEAFPNELQTIATSLKIAAGKDIDRAKLVSKVLHYLERYTSVYEMHGFKPIKLLWESYNCTIGTRIRATMLRETVEGLATAITDDGVLLVKLDDGEIRKIISADISLLGER